MRGCGSLVTMVGLLVGVLIRLLIGVLVRVPEVLHVMGGRYMVLWKLNAGTLVAWSLSLTTSSRLIAVASGFASPATVFAT